MEIRQYLVIDFDTYRNCASDGTYNKKNEKKFFEKEMLCFIMLLFTSQHNYDESLGLEYEKDKYNSVVDEYRELAMK